MKGKRLFAFLGLFAIAVGGIARDGATTTVCAQESVATACQWEDDAVSVGDFTVRSRLLELLLENEDEETSAGEERMLIPWGGVFGARIKGDHPTVRQAEDGCGVKNGDRITHAYGIEIERVCELDELIRAQGGQRIPLTVIRRGQETEVTVSLKPTQNGYTLPFELQEGAAGIGTVTYIDPESMTFGGLGHGICDPDTGEVMNMNTGSVCGVILGGVQRGESGKPGELCGILNDRQIGSLYANTEVGVFGRLNAIPKSRISAIPAGKPSDVKVGKAKVISTVKNGMTEEYSIEITSVNLDATGSKCFRIKVTDPTLLALTGGVVRGMSGSPIIQNGKLVGAVTHVMVADPTEGYGIFIENMLAATQQGVQPKAA